MIAILEKTEHNTDFHQIVDFLEASHIRYALTICPTVYVSHIRQFWSTARIETTNQDTKILATVDGKPRTISESSRRRHIKLSDEEGISSLPNAELFENLSLTGYNILPKQRFTFQKGQFSHQLKFLIHTIMQCLSPKSTGFNEFSSNVATVVGKGSANPTEPHHTPSPQEHHSPPHDSPPPSHLTTTTEQIPQAPTESLTLRKYTRRAIQIAQSKALSPAADEPASLSRDDSQGESFLTVFSLDEGWDRENINKTYALPHDSSPRVTSLDADEGSMQQILHELMELCTSLQRKEEEQSQLKRMFQSQGVIEIREELGADKSIELGSNDTEEMVNLLSSMEAANILTSEVAAASVSHAAGVSTAGVPTVSRGFPTVSAIFTTASVVTPYTRRPRGITIGGAQHMRSPIIGAKDKGKQKVVETELVRDLEIARLHAEEELKMMIEEKIELISELVKYQDHRTKILKYQAHQSKPLSKKEQREFYMAVLRSHPGWKTKHFRGMTLEQIKEKFIPVWKQLEDFVPMSSKGEDVSEEELKGMMQLVPLEEVYVEALQVKHPIIDCEIHSKGKKEYWKIIRLGVQDEELIEASSLGEFVRSYLVQDSLAYKGVFRLCTRIIESTILKLFSHFIVIFHFSVILLDYQRSNSWEQHHPTHYTQNSSTRSQQATTRNRKKAIVNSPPPIYDQESFMVAEDDEIPTNNNLRTTSNTSRANQDNSLRISRGTGYDNQRHVARECQKPKRVKDAAYHREKMLLFKQEEAGIQLNAEQADWRDDTDDESEDQELEAHYMYMAQIQEVTLDVANDSEPIFDTEPVQKVQNNENYNVFAIESEHPGQSKSVHDTYSIEQDEHNVIIDSLDMSYDRDHIDQNDDDNDLANERELIASLIEKLKCEIDDSKNRNKFLETSNKVLVDKLKGKIEDFKTKNTILESSNNHFKEANNKLSETNKLMYTDLKKFQAELDRRNNVEYALKVEIDCAKAKGDLVSYKIESQKSFNKYT
nr:hypothetical protein [Tanacetum cinerariifolium]